MAWTTSRNIDKIPPMHRDRVDSSKVTTVSANIRYQCMHVTMELIKKLEPISSGDRFECTVRGLMMVAHGVPIKTMCVGLYPYEQNILPAIATALAYCPMVCNGATPSVQILCQAMAKVAMQIQSSTTNKNKKKGQYTGLSELMFQSKFLMLLRCSYLCTVVGVAFVNCVPVPVDGSAKRVMCMSFFSEWLGDMIKIHHSFGFKMTILAMGAPSANSVRRTFSSFRGTSEMVNYFGVTNPAAISYMNVDKYRTQAPCPNSVSHIEMYVDRIMGWHPTTNETVSYHWTVYPKTVLSQYLGQTMIGTMTRALVGHNADELLSYFTEMAKNLFNNASMGVGTNPSPIRIPTDAVKTNIPPEAEQHDSASQGPVHQHAQAQVHHQGGGAPNVLNVQQSGQTYRSGDQGPFYVGRNSLIAQLRDETGKNKSQQTIIIESMIATSSTVLESYRNMEAKVDTLTDRITTLIDRTSLEDEELEEIVDACKSTYPNLVRELEGAVSVFAAMPTLIEGNMGVIESEIGPSAPLMRRYDGSTMSDAVYQQMRSDADTGIAQSRNPPTGTGTGMFTNVGTPFIPGSSGTQARSSAMNTAQNNSMTMLGYKTQCGQLFWDAAESLDESQQEDLMKTVMEDAGTELELSDIIIAAMARYTKENEGQTPTTDMVKKLFSWLDFDSDETLHECAVMMKDAYEYEHPDMITTFFDEL